MIIAFIVHQKIKDESEKDKVENTLLELKLSTIHSKMNPHFMFNSLNTIIYLLTVEKYSEAEQLLEDFSLLLRRYLDKNDSTFITLAEEMEIIELYLSIQQTRYNHQFDYEIDLPESISHIIIPTILIQPFIENAIIHGLAHSDQQGKISVKIEKINEVIHIEIRDNGIGMVASKNIKKHQSKHESKGILLIHEKINVIERMYKTKILLDIKDVDEDQATGVIITLKIPIDDKMLNS